MSCERTGAYTTPLPDVLAPEKIFAILETSSVKSAESIIFLDIYAVGGVLLRPKIRRSSVVKYPVYRDKKTWQRERG